MEYLKYPIGIKPKWVYDKECKQKRFEELFLAIIRYKDFKNDNLDKLSLKQQDDIKLCISKWNDELVEIFKEIYYDMQ